MKFFLINFLTRLLLYFEKIKWRFIYKSYRYKYSISDDFKFNGSMIKLYGDGEIECSAGSYIGELSTLQSLSGCTIKIGENCRISHNVRMYTGSWRPDCDFEMSEPEEKLGNIVISSHSWIGANVFIAPGVVIGKNSVVGANSVVTKSVPPNEIWGGVPAKFIRTKETK